MTTSHSSEDFAEFEFDDRSCPFCEHAPTHYRKCDNGCSNGLLDMAEEDPIN